MDGAERIGRESLLTLDDTNLDIKGTGDFNNDGHVDLLWRNEASGQNSVWYMDGAERIGEAALATVPSSDWQLLA